MPVHKDHKGKMPKGMPQKEMPKMPMHKNRPKRKGK